MLRTGAIPAELLCRAFLSTTNNLHSKWSPNKLPRSPARRRLGKYFLLIKHSRADLSKAEILVHPASWPCSPDSGDRGRRLPLTAQLCRVCLLLFTQVCAPGLSIPRLGGALDFNQIRPTKGAGIVVFPSHESIILTCCSRETGLCNYWNSSLEPAAGPCTSSWTGDLG